MNDIKTEFKLNEKTSRLEFKLDENDVEHVRKIYALTESEGWHTLKDYYALAREQIIESVKKASRTGKDGLAAQRGAMLDGFDQSVLVVVNLLTRAEELANSQKIELKEAINDGPPDRPFDLGEI